ncbi:hypothetical protein MJO29_009742 [Puccinia striiformis f. sp. tritici]|nr:hypothetical protein MJO29_009742 [Puccinia striiformis f. sp. tritici]
MSEWVLKGSGPLSSKITKTIIYINLDRYTRMELPLRSTERMLSVEIAELIFLGASLAESQVDSRGVSEMTAGEGSNDDVGVYYF